MEQLTGSRLLLAAGFLASWFAVSSEAADDILSYPLEVFAREDKTVTDLETGATLTFVTTDPALDMNLYFHERSWLSDSSLVLFYSHRKGGGLMGYVVQTGELVRIAAPNGDSVSHATAAVHKNSVYALHGNDVCEFALRIESAYDPSSGPSRVFASRRLICTLPPTSHRTFLNESCDGKRLALGIAEAMESSGPVILLIEVETGKMTPLVRIPDPPNYGGHVQWSRSNPYLLSFAGIPVRIQVVDIRDGVVRSPYVPWRNELVTHECWWVEDQILFCGGTHPKPAEDSHVKALDLRTGLVRIVGAGSWWPGGTPEELAKRNWWHAAGSEDGRWIAADNWHGDIMLFEGRTTRPRLLTVGHRTYGKGEHPHVGWDRQGKQVVFTSHMLGDVNVCIATIPDSWQEEPQAISHEESETAP